MKKSIKFFSIVSIILIAIVLFTSEVYAANDSFKTTLNVNSSSVKRGDSIIVTIGLSDIAIESGEKGIGAYTAKIDYDTSVLELQSETTSGTNNWEAPVCEGKLIVGNTKKGDVVNTKQSIGTITFKVKENASLGDTVIKLTNFYGSNAVNDILGESSSIKVTILDENGNADDGTGSGNGSGNTGDNGTGSGNGSGNTGDNGTGSENGSGNVDDDGTGLGNGNVNLSDGGNDSKTSNSSKSSSNVEDLNANRPTMLPQTGLSYTVLFVLIGLVLLIAIRLLIKIRVINKKIGRHE